MKIKFSEAISGPCKISDTIISLALMNIDNLSIDEERTYENGKLNNWAAKSLIGFGIVEAVSIDKGNIKGKPSNKDWASVSKMVYEDIKSKIDLINFNWSDFNEKDSSKDEVETWISEETRISFKNAFIKNKSQSKELLLDFLETKNTFSSKNEFYEEYYEYGLKKTKNNPAKNVKTKKTSASGPTNRVPSTFYLLNFWLEAIEHISTNEFIINIDYLINIDASKKENNTYIKKKNKETVLVDQKINKNTHFKNFLEKNIKIRRDSFSRSLKERYIQEHGTRDPVHHQFDVEYACEASHICDVSKIKAEIIDLFTHNFKGNWEDMQMADIEKIYENNKTKIEDLFFQIEDPLNGIFFDLNTHHAFDNYLISLSPETLQIKVEKKGIGFDDLDGINLSEYFKDEKTIKYLEKKYTTT